MSKESVKLRNELDKLSGRIVGSNVLQSPLGFWARYDTWRETVKGLEEAIKRMEENDGNIREDFARDRLRNSGKYGEEEGRAYGSKNHNPKASKE